MLMLPELENIIDTIIPEEEPYLFKENEDEFIDMCIQLMHEYIDENPTLISEPDFHETMIENVKELFFIHFENNPFFNEDLEDDLDELIDIAAELFYIQCIPPRSFPNTFIIEKPNCQLISEKIKYLSEKPQPQQRTPEWYEFRHKLITASNAYKAFETQSTQNQLIYEKCQPLFIPDPDAVQQPVCVTSTLHWGQKYEPLSVMIYEDSYKTHVGDFGCIQHEKYSFLGASPDGINIDEKNLRYGRMLEIKNIVNREINGIPKIEYWIQMQLQMETCDLDECDFLETRFTEYENEELYTNDDDDDTLKGIIMYFSTPEGKPHYIYKPLYLTNVDEWEQQNMEENSKLNYAWIKNIYWKLDQFSCVLVLRNKKWFQDNIPELRHVWSIIEKERIIGSSHRAPNKRFKKVDAIEPLGENKCALNIDKEGKVNIKNNIISSIKVRTESMDETKSILF